MQRRGGIAIAAIAAIGVCWPSLGRAQEGPPSFPPCTREPTEADIAGAKGAFTAGQASFEEADYARAIIYWGDAYRRDCTAHALLLNLARAYELSGAKAEAAFALTTYLERVPSTPDREKIQRRIEALRRAEDAVQAAPPAPPAPPVTTAGAAPTATQQPTVAASPAAPAPRIDANSGTSLGKVILPIGIAGAGAVIAGVGSVLYFDARSDLRDAQEACGGGHVCSGAQKDELVDDGNAIRRRVNITGGVTIGGIALLGGGLTWLLLELSSDDSTRASSPSELTPVVASGFAALSYSGSF